MHFRDLNRFSQCPDPNQACQEQVPLEVVRNLYEATRCETEKDDESVSKEIKKKKADEFYYMYAEGSSFLHCTRCREPNMGGSLWLAHATFQRSSHSPNIPPMEHPATPPPVFFPLLLLYG